MADEETTERRLSRPLVLALSGPLAAGPLTQDAGEAGGTVAALMVVARAAVLTAQHGVVADASCRGQTERAGVISHMFPKPFFASQRRFHKAQHRAAELNPNQREAEVCDDALLPRQSERRTNARGHQTNTTFDMLISLSWSFTFCCSLIFAFSLLTNR